MVSIHKKIMAVIKPTIEQITKKVKDNYLYDLRNKEKDLRGFGAKVSKEMKKLNKDELYTDEGTMKLKAMIPVTEMVVVMKKWGTEFMKDKEALKYLKSKGYIFS